jgi:hypothetical protein
MPYQPILFILRQTTILLKPTGALLLVGGVMVGVGWLLARIPL